MNYQHFSNQEMNKHYFNQEMNRHYSNQSLNNRHYSNQEMNKIIQQERIKKGEKDLVRKNKEVKKKITQKKDILFNEIFDKKGFIDIVKKYKLEKIVFFLFIILIFIHVSFGYTITLKRVIMVGSLTISFVLLYIIYFFIQDKKFFVDFILEEKYQKYRPLFTLGVILLFILMNVFIHKIIPFQKLKKYNFTFPIDNIE